MVRKVGASGLSPAPPSPLAPADGGRGYALRQGRAEPGEVAVVELVRPRLEGEVALRVRHDPSDVEEDRPRAGEGQRKITPVKVARCAWGSITAVLWKVVE